MVIADWSSTCVHRVSVDSQSKQSEEAIHFSATLSSLNPARHAYQIYYYQHPVLKPFTSRPSIRKQLASPRRLPKLLDCLHSMARRTSQPIPSQPKHPAKGRTPVTHITILSTNFLFCSGVSFSLGKPSFDRLAVIQALLAGCLVTNLRNGSVNASSSLLAAPPPIPQRSFSTNAGPHALTTLS